MASAKCANGTFEVWNEPNLSAFWTGTQADYFKLYQYTVNAIKSIDEHLCVSGPATANDEWIADFIAYCDQHKLAADFVSTHHYPTDAFGKPGDDTETQLSLATRGILHQRTQETCRAAGGKPVYYTEWSSSSNPFFHRHDEPYAAAFLIKNMLDVASLVHGYSWWTFSDIFEENYFSSVPFHGGFGLQTIHGIAKPVYRAMQILNNVGAEILHVDGMHRTVDAWVIRKDDDNVTVVLTNHAFPKHEIRTEAVTFTLNGSRKPLNLTVERIDRDHCNPRRTWREIASPDFPDKHQLELLEKASQLIREPLQASAHEHGIDFTLNLPPHGIAAVHVQYRKS